MSSAEGSGPSIGPLYNPTNPTSTPTWQLLNSANARFNLQLKTYEELYDWSITNIASFWDLVWDITNVIGDKGSSVVVNESALPADNPLWFPDATLNYAENLLRHRTSSKVALIQATEPTPDFPELTFKQLTYSDLYAAVHQVVCGLKALNLDPGDRVASYSSNCIENVVACLAATALGCIWVSAAADFGPDGVFERFEQVKPAVIFVVDAVAFDGRVHNHIPKVKTLLSKLDTQSNIQPTVVVIHTIPHPTSQKSWSSDWISWDHFQKEPTEADIPFARLPFNHPLWILFSSGTTGKPKAIVHRSGGMLLQSNKELGICSDLNADDVFFYYTTTGWMMWNFLIGGLNSGCTLVLYDGRPLKDRSLLWTLTDLCGITIFGTSAKYLDALSKGYKPREHHHLNALRHIYSTGSPLSPPLFDYVYTDIKKDVLLGSITGGTDICSLFAGMNASLPVYRGEIQCRMLGMAVKNFSAGGTAQAKGADGELVCLRPFPCEPLGFWPLEGYGSEDEVLVAQKRFHNAYFAEYPGVWYHGDHISIAPSKSDNAGGVVMLGRSDGVLNPGGVRFGTAEIYDVLDTCFSSPTSSFQILDYVAVGRTRGGGTDEQVILFVKLEPGNVLDSSMVSSIKSEIRRARTSHHVPSKIFQTDEIPYTLNGKRVEVLLKKILNGASIKDVNPSTLLNPGCLDYYVELRNSLS
ncbi:acetoacetyl-CoA synthetase [Flagelloscypha sp. PMI_526]|nr:acetoacetyl-CoA synthetase [Flagelloscypha sp. PMI_526]